MNTFDHVTDQMMDEAEKLIWDYLDDRIEEGDIARLEKLITDNEQIRSRYLQCAEIHTNLYEHYRMETSPEGKSPVLGFLGDFSTSAASPKPLDS